MINHHPNYGPSDLWSPPQNANSESSDSSDSNSDQIQVVKSPDPSRSTGIANKRPREPDVIAGTGVTSIPALWLPAQDKILAHAIPPAFGPSMIIDAQSQMVQFGHTVTQALRNDTCLASSEFLDRLFPEKSAPIPITNAVFMALARAGYWDPSARSFKKMENNRLAMGEWLNGVGKTMGDVYNRTPDRLWYLGCFDVPPVHPGLVLLSREVVATVPRLIDWVRIRSFAEVTSSLETPTEMILTINGRSYYLFLCQFDRRFATALSFNGSGECSFILTDREGQIRYTLSMKNNGLEHAQFLKILSFLMFGRDSDIGLDPHFVRNPESDKLVAVNVEDSRYELVDHIYTFKGLRGRGTNVWIVTRNGERYVLKDSWVPERYVESEIDHLKAMLGHPQLESLVPTFVAGGEIKINGITDSTTNYRGSGLIGRPGNQHTHRRSVVSSVGKPLTSFRSKKEFVKAVIDVVGAHKYLCEKLKILHADISTGNIMLHQPNENARATGLLIDFDCAKTINDINGGVLVGFRDGSVEIEGANKMYSWRGTAPFVSMEASLSYPKPFNHQPCHDLESILYVILYFCTYFKGPGLLRTSTDFPDMHSIPLESWFRQQPLKQLGRDKIGALATAEISILAKFTPYWADFVPFARRLISTCFPDFRDLKSKLTHDNVAKILEEAYNTIEEPLEPPMSITSGAVKRRRMIDPTEINRDA